MLKDWLVRRRENPYPSREEKKTLAHDTGELNLRTLVDVFNEYFQSQVSHTLRSAIGSLTGDES